jgi:hypothetical protein
MKTLNRFIEKVGVDKVLHFVVGGWIVAKFLELGGLWVGFGGILFLCFISIIKEVFLDKESGADWFDILSAILGGVVELLTYYLITII